MPPASITSALPARMASAASPMAWAPVAQAETTARFGPRAPRLIDICPEAMSQIIIGTRKGLTRSGPRRRSTSICSPSVIRPPIPEPM